MRTQGDWEGWTAFFLECVREAADDGVLAAQRLFRLLDEDRRGLANRPRVTVPAIRLLDTLPEHPMVTLAGAIRTLRTTKPTAAKAIEVLRRCGVLHEVTGKRRDRVYAYRAYLRVLAEDTQLPPDRQAPRGERRSPLLHQTHERLGNAFPHATRLQTK